MTPDESPFPLGWYATGPEALWPHRQTFDFVPYAWLPPLPEFPVDPAFAWLSPTSFPCTRLGWEDDSDRPGTPEEQLGALEVAALTLGLRLPSDFAPFALKPTIHRRIPTCTGCYLELSRTLIEDPSGKRGRLLRFLNDSQLSMVWYLYLAPSGDHCVLASGQWHDGDEEQDETADASEYFFCAPSFRHFLFRYWLENTIWFRVWRKMDLSPFERDYVTLANLARTNAAR